MAREQEETRLVMLPLAARGKVPEGAIFSALALDKWAEHYSHLLPTAPILPRAGDGGQEHRLFHQRPPRRSRGQEGIENEPEKLYRYI